MFKKRDKNLKFSHVFNEEKRLFLASHKGNPLKKRAAKRQRPVR